MKTITILQGNEFNADPTPISEENSFFYSVYEQATTQLLNIIEANEKFNCSMSEEKCITRKDSTFVANRKLLGSPNNIIAFCADRGQGKTTSMISFSKALERMDEKILQRVKAKNYTFQVVRQIDPTVMSGKDSILRIILSRLFGTFQEHYEKQLSFQHTDWNNGQTILDAQKNELITLFQQCLRNLNSMQSDATENYEEDELEKIIEQSDSSQMRGSLYRLFDAYLNFMAQTSRSIEEKRMLVIQIDDADMNVALVYRIVEEVCKYLTMPNVLVLMAANMVQLEATIEQHFIQAYEISIRYNGMTSKDRCHQIAEQYINKIFPGARQINLPNLHEALQYDSNHIHLCYKPRGSEQSDNLLCEKDAYRYSEQLLELLNRKTGIFFLKPTNYSHNLLPKTMRELTHFVAFFDTLKDVECDYLSIQEENSDGHAIEVWLNNICQLEHYLLNIWAPYNLKEEACSFLRNFSTEALEDKHRRLIAFSPAYYARECAHFGNSAEQGTSAKQLEMDFKIKFFQMIQSAGFYEFQEEDGFDEMDIDFLWSEKDDSFVEAQAALSVLNEMPNCSKQYAFVYAIQLHYSIYMHRLLLTELIATQKTSSGLERGGKMLSRFLGNILYIPTEISTLSFGEWLQPFDISIPWWLTSAMRETQESQAILKRYCRKKTLGTRMYRMETPSNLELVNYANNAKSDYMLHCFYSDLNALECAGHVNSDKLKTARAMLLLMNCDVRASLKKELSTIKKSDEVIVLPSNLESLYTEELLKISATNSYIGKADFFLKTAEQDKNTDTSSKSFAFNITTDYQKSIEFALMLSSRKMSTLFFSTLREEIQDFLVEVAGNQQEGQTTDPKNFHENRAKAIDLIIRRMEFVYDLIKKSFQMQFPNLSMPQKYAEAFDVNDTQKLRLQDLIMNAKIAKTAPVFPPFDKYEVYINAFQELVGKSLVELKKKSSQDGTTNNAP